MSLLHWALIAMIGTIFGASFALNEVLLDEFGPLSISMLRVCVGAVGCWAWAIASRKPMRLDLSTLIAVVAFGFFQFAMPFAVLPLAQGQITSSVAGIANAMTPVMVVIVSHFWIGGEKATLRKSIGVGLGMVGTVILMTGGPEIGISDWRFALLAMTAPLSYAVGLNIVTKLKSIDPVVTTTWAMTGGAFLITPFALVTDGVPHATDPSVLNSVAFFGIGLTTLPFLMMFTILPRVGATNLSLVTFVAPVSAITIGAFALHEPTGTSQFAGLTLILLALVTLDGRLLGRLSRLGKSRLATRSFRQAPPKRHHRPFAEN
ncbi:DMT family transporter [Aliiroseovarius sp. KMU-50]|uniref:DMT family transporter n=1 Tax=Aliiroseovarius salicola TaxID=3009082 RepID=A0ABT4VX47_9RHOB|nr:DMT family transporter [Aliiroseovarius sp. KMU-50]MDA5092796.1 DMT family transporter [Aliiroseovarius sp. KMU-50]